jgi:TRAP-type transport system periplasmic protein
MEGKMKVENAKNVMVDRANWKYLIGFFLIIIPFFCSWALPHTAQAEGPIKWKYYHITPPLHHDVSTMREFASDVQKLTNGELQIKVYSLGEVPYKPTEIVSVIRDRFMDGGVLVSDFVSGEIPLFNFTNLPMLITDLGEQEKAMPILLPYLERELKKRGLTLLFWRYNSQKGLFGRGKAVEKLDDFKGRKIRSFGSADAEFLKRLGAIPVTMPSTEVSTAMQRGVMDAFIASAFYSVGLRWDETCDWGYLIDMTAITSYECVNSNSLAELSAANQKILFDTAAKYQVRWNKEILELEDKARESMAKAGKKMIQMTKEDRVKATEIIKPFWDEWANSMGPDATEALRKIRDVLGK